MNIKRRAASIELESVAAVIDSKLGKLLEAGGGREGGMVPLPERVHVLLYYLRKFLTSYKFPTFVIYVFKVASLRCGVTLLLNMKGVTPSSYRRVKSIPPLSCRRLRLLDKEGSYIYIYKISFIPFHNFVQIIIFLPKHVSIIHQDINQFLFKNKRIFH